MYADALKGNVIEHVAAETGSGKTAYIGTRLKLVDGKITEVEINFAPLTSGRHSSKNKLLIKPFGMASHKKMS